MNKVLTFVLLVSLILIVAVGCATAASEPTATPMPTVEEGMAHDMETEEMTQEKVEETGGHGAEAHQPASEGQVGMARAAAMSGADFHLEIVSETPGQYLVYLSDENRKPVSPEGYEGTVAVVKPDGSEIASMPLKVVGDHLVAEGGPTDDSQLDVRLNLKGPDLIDVVEMDFTLSYTE
jgi:hypothetical protein